MEDQIIKIILADDSTTFLDGLQLILSRNKQYKIIEVCHNGQELIESKMLDSANLILTDIDMPVFDGIEAAKQINFKHPKLPMIALTMHQEKVFLQDMILAGFKGFIYKPEIPTTIHEIIKKVINSEFIFPENLK